MTDDAEDYNTIQRCPHDKENPYAQINRDLIRDQSLTPECRWFIMYLLSMKDGWKINMKQIQEHVKPHMGRDRVRKMFNEAIDAGYMLRQECKEEIRRTDGTYGGAFKRVRYFISENPKFKKFLPQSGFQRADNPGAENPPYKETSSEKKEHKQELSVVGAVAPPSEVLEKKETLSKKESLEESDSLPQQAAVLNGDGSRLKVTQSQLYEHIFRKRLELSSDAIIYAWNSLCQYEGVVHDWRRFFEGTARNYETSKKSKQIAGAQKCQTNNKKTQRQGSCKDSNAASSETDSSAQPSPPLVSLKSLLPESRNLFRNLRSF